MYRYPRSRVSKKATSIICPISNQTSDAAMLEKYGLKANDAILADPEKHMGLYEDLIQNRDAKLIAGGAAQNTARGAAVCQVIYHRTYLLTFLVLPPRKVGCICWSCGS
jgi:hypothetical protein